MSRRRWLVLIGLGIVFALLTVWILYGFVMEQRGFYAPGS